MKICKQHDKRKHKRIPIVTLCDIFLHESTTSNGKGCLTNCSLGGFSIVTALELSVREEIHIRIDIEKEEINFHGEVIYKRHVMEGLHAYGVRFLNLNIFKRCRIRRKLVNWFYSQRESTESLIKNVKNGNL